MSNCWDVVILGCGQLGGNLKTLLEAEKIKTLGVRRTAEPEDPTRLALDLDLPASWDVLSALPLSERAVFVGIVTPDARTEAAYRQRYVGVASRLRQLSALPGRSHPVVWVSSTAVFGDAQQGRLTESVQPQPSHWRGEVVLEAEQAVSASPSPHAVLRCTGLYSAASVHRLHALEMRAQLDPQQVSNRMHRADAASWLAHLVTTLHTGRSVPSLVHGVDECSSTYGAIWDRLDGASPRLVPAKTGRIIDSMYRSEMPPLAFPSLDAVMGVNAP